MPKHSSKFRHPTIISGGSLTIIMRMPDSIREECPPTLWPLLFLPTPTLIHTLTTRTPFRITLIDTAINRTFLSYPMSSRQSRLPESHSLALLKLSNQSKLSELQLILFHFFLFDCVVCTLCLNKFRLADADEPFSPPSPSRLGKFKTAAVSSDGIPCSQIGR